MSKEFRIGILAVVAIAAGIWGYKFLLGQNILASQQIFKARFDNVDNLRQSNAVVLKGYQVGTVLSISPDPEDRSKLLVSFEVDSDWKLPKDAKVTIVNESLMGTKTLRIDADRLCSGNDCAKSGDYLEGRNLSLLGSLVEKGEIRGYAEEIGQGLDLLFDTLENRINDPDSDDAISESVRGLRNTLTNLARSTAQLDMILRESAAGFQGMVGNLERITSAVANNNAQIEDILKNTAEITRQIKESNIAANANSFLDKSGQAIISLEATMKEANETFAQLSDLLIRIKEGEGTLGKLATDDELYFNLQRTSKNLDLLLQDFRLNPKRYIDIRVFGKGRQIDYTVPEEDPAFEKHKPE